MTLHEAYQGWQMAKDNRALYNSTRDAFRKTWLMLPTNRPCGYYTLEVLTAALVQTKTMQEYRVKASSVMVNVLIYAHNQAPDENPLPRFTYNEILLGARELEGGPVEKPQVPAEGIGDTDLDTDPVTGTPRRAMAQEGPAPVDPLEGISFDADKPTIENMKQEKKQFGTAPKRVCQIDPEALKVVRTYDSCSQACKAVGVKSIDYALKHLCKAGGYYWAYPEDIFTFEERLRKKQSVGAPPAVKPASVEKHEIPSYDRFIHVDDIKKSIKTYSDKELIDELKERGWKGDLKLTLSVNL